MTITYPFASLPENLAAFCALLRGAYRFVDARGEPGWDPDTHAVSIFASGVTVPEAVQATIEVFLTATERGGGLVIYPPTP